MGGCLLGYLLHASIEYVMWSVDHAMNCPTGGYPTLCHNELIIRDFTAVVLSRACCDTNVDPMLQPLSGETLTYATTTNEDGACLNVCALGFWGSQHQRAFLILKF